MSRWFYTHTHYWNKHFAFLCWIPYNCGWILVKYTLCLKLYCWSCAFVHGGLYSFICLLNTLLCSSMVQVRSGWAVSRRDRYNQIAIFYRYLFYTFWILHHYGPHCYILIDSFTTVACPQCFTMLNGWIGCLSAGYVRYVSCFVLNTQYYRFLYIQHKFFYCNFFSTPIYITAKLLYTLLPFCPKKITSPLAPLP